MYTQLTRGLLAIAKFLAYSVLLPHDAMHSADYAVARCLAVRHMTLFCQNG